MERPWFKRRPNVFPDNHTSDSFLGRASYAASRLFIARDDSGKKKFNTSYLLGALASAAVANTTYRRYRTQLVPYQAQSVSGTFGNFGSTVGGDAGERIFQQFWPQIHQILRGHSLKVLQRSRGLNCQKFDAAGRTAFNLGEVAGPEHSGVAVRRGQS